MEIKSASLVLLVEFVTEYSQENQELCFRGEAITLAVVFSEIDLRETTEFWQAFSTTGLRNIANTCPGHYGSRKLCFCSIFSSVIVTLWDATHIAQCSFFRTVHARSQLGTSYYSLSALQRLQTVLRLNTGHYHTSSCCCVLNKTQNCHYKLN